MRSRPGSGGRFSEQASAAWVAYAALLVASAVASTKAAIDLYSQPAEMTGFAPLPPPPPAPLPDFNIVDDRPADGDP
jgi:hypothetical protein